MDWPISQFLDSACPYDHVTFERDSTSMAGAVYEMSKFRRLWVQIAKVHRRPQCRRRPTINGLHVLYDFCIDGSRHESPDVPWTVSSFNMMDDEGWAL